MPTSTNLRTVERFERLDDFTLNYSITVEDPEIITQPLTIAYPMRRDDDYGIYEYACHEDNTSVRNYILTSRYECAQQGAGQ